MRIISWSGKRPRPPASVRAGHGGLPVAIALAGFLTAAWPAGGIPSAAERESRDRDACPSFAEAVDRTAAQWPDSPHFALQEQVGRSFIAGYNRTRTGGAALVADTVVVFPLLRFDTWYALAGHDGCFVFWTELAPDKMQKLMENGPRGPVDSRHEEF